MDIPTTPVVIGVRFSKVGKVYHFDASQVPDVQLGDSVVVETSRGWQIGTVAELAATPEGTSEGLKRIDRKATPRDLVISQSWKAKEPEVMAAAKKRANELSLSGVKVIAADYSFDGARLSVIYSSETDEKVELKSLRQDLQRMFGPAQVELRQIGPRDVAKLLGGMGACGLEQRCCSQFLCEFSSISIRMAKEQGISLTPSEITGMCGRLRCCLIYEYQQYVDARARLPKRNKRVMTVDGEGKVVDVVPIREAVIVEYPDGIRREVKAEMATVIEDGAPLPPRPVPPQEDRDGDDELNRGERFPSSQVERAPESTRKPQPIERSQHRQPGSQAESRSPKPNNRPAERRPNQSRRRGRKKPGNP